VGRGRCLTARRDPPSTKSTGGDAVVLELVVVVAAILIAGVVGVRIGWAAELALARLRSRWPEIGPIR